MDRNTFARLCYLLTERGGLHAGKVVGVEEQVAIFLGVLAHHKKNRIVRFEFWRSGATVSYYVNKVFGVVLSCIQFCYQNLHQPATIVLIIAGNGSRMGGINWRLSCVEGCGVKGKWTKSPTRDPPTRMYNQGHGDSTEDLWSINQGSLGGSASNVNPMMDQEIRATMEGLPDCSCGKGKMELRITWKTATNPGRYYWKCPYGGKHQGSFMWYDEKAKYNAAPEATVEGHFGQKINAIGKAATADDPRPGGVAKNLLLCTICGLHNAYSSFTLHLVFGFMAVVLVLLGILIRKVL
ncbi:uncharacterized protein LOC121773422 [Salvia splendens]|uniref:uncharacterized protein LOC121773422 n=1 Tax=Salvia splendens TaxID=180675 RepID=UPI001C255051|nr:uncharacterized protein LOC121773422 [Salvia splendens]